MAPDSFDVVNRYIRDPTTIFWCFVVIMVVIWIVLFYGLRCCGMGAIKALVVGLLVIQIVLVYYLDTVCRCSADLEHWSRCYFIAVAVVVIVYLLVSGFGCGVPGLTWLSGWM